VVEELGAEPRRLNFGCPVPKVTRRAAGAAIPAHPVLLATSSPPRCKAAGDVPVTVKMRLGLDATASRWGPRPGGGPTARRGGPCTARTASSTTRGRPLERHRRAQADSSARAGAMRHLARSDACDDAETGCDGVVVGRGCSATVALRRAGRRGSPGGPSPATRPRLRLCVVPATPPAGYAPRGSALLEMRKHVRWYFHDVEVAAPCARLVSCTSLES